MAVALIADAQVKALAAIHCHGWSRSTSACVQCELGRSRATRMVLHSKRRLLADSTLFNLIMLQFTEAVLQSSRRGRKNEQTYKCIHVTLGDIYVLVNMLIVEFMRWNTGGVV
jgi:hypothetical protein